MRFKAVFLTIIFGGLSVFGYSSPQEFNIPDSETEGIYCPPQGKIYENFRLIDGTIVTRPLYASEILGISDQASYEFEKLARLIDFDDGCDRVGALYIAKFLARVWPGTEEFNKQDKELQKLVLDILHHPNIPKPPMMWNVRIEARELARKLHNPTHKCAFTMEDLNEDLNKVADTLTPFQRHLQNKSKEDVKSVEEL